MIAYPLLQATTGKVRQVSVLMWVISGALILVGIDPVMGILTG